jgi:hypothetical protein
MGLNPTGSEIPRSLTNVATTIDQALDLKVDKTDLSLGVVPPLRRGMSILFEEDFAAETNLSAAWTSKTNATMFKGGVIAGPRLRRNSDSVEYSYALAVPRPTAAQISAGYNTPNAKLNLPTSGFACVSVWFRSAAVRQAGGPILFISDVFGNDVDALRTNVFSGSRQDHETQLVMGNNVVQYSAVPTGDWVQAWLAINVATKTSTWCIRTADGIVQRFNSFTSLYAFGQVTLGRFNATGPTSPNTPAFSGQISGFRVYTCDSIETALDGPADYLPPEYGTTYSVSTTGDDSIYLGPWATVNKAISAINDSIVMGSATNFFDLNGVKRDYVSLSTTENRRAFCADYEQGLIVSNPANDSIAIDPGVYRPTGTLAINGLPLGISLVGSKVNQTSEIRFSTVLSGSWTQDGTYTRCWRYGSAVATIGYPVAPGRVAFTPVQGASETEAKTRLNTKNYGAWVSPSGDLFISLPTGVTPASLSALTPSGQWELCSGSFVFWNGGLIRNIKFTGLGGVLYNQGASGRIVSGAGCAVDVGNKVTTVFEDCVGEGFSKHVMYVVGQVAEGLVLFVRPRFGGQAPRSDNSWDGAVPGDYSPLVDYCDEQVGDGNIVTCYIDPQQSDVGYVAIPGRSIGTRWVSGAADGSPYYTHDNNLATGTLPFALTILSFPSVMPSGFAPSTRPTTTHQDYEIIEGRMIDGSNLATTLDLSSYATTSAVAAGYQPLDADLTAIAALTTTSTGRALLTESVAATGTGALVRAASPTVTGTLNAAAITASGTGTFSEGLNVYSTAVGGRVAYFRSNATSQANCQFVLDSPTDNNSGVVLQENATDKIGIFYNSIVTSGNRVADTFEIYSFLSSHPIIRLHQSSGLAMSVDASGNTAFTGNLTASGTGTFSSISETSVAATGTGALVRAASPTLTGTLNAAGVSLSANARFTEQTYTPTGTTQTIDLNSGNLNTLSLGSTTGDVTLTLTVPTSAASGRIKIIQHGTTARGITIALSAGTAVWYSAIPAFSSQAISKKTMLSYTWDGTDMSFQAAEAI